MNIIRTIYANNTDQMRFSIKIHTYNYDCMHSVYSQCDAVGRYILVMWIWECMLLFNLLPYLSIYKFKWKLCHYTPFVTFLSCNTYSMVVMLCFVCVMRTLTWIYDIYFALFLIIFYLYIYVHTAFVYLLINIFLVLKRIFLLLSNHLYFRIDLIYGFSKANTWDANLTIFLLAVKNKVSKNVFVELMYNVINLISQR